MGKRFLRTFLFMAAFVMAAFSTNLLPVTAAGATNGNPGGNNGFVKVSGTKFDNIPNNQPHVGCSFRLEFYNYDLNSGNATVTFELQSPTKGPGYSLNVSGGNLTPFIGGDTNGGSNDLDADETYTLGFTGVPHQNQGYHVKLTVTAQGTNGNDTKHKVFWVQPCERPVVDTQITPCTDRQNGTGTVVVTVNNPNATVVNYTVELGGTTKNVAVAAMTSKNVTFTGVNPGAQTVKVTGDNGTEKTKSITVDVCQPLAPIVDAEAVGCSWPHQAIGSGVVTIENPNAQSVTYDVTLNGITKTITIGAYNYGHVWFDHLALTSYTATVVGNNNTSASASFDMYECAPMPVPSAPGLTASAACVATGATGSVTIKVTNPDSFDVDYVVALDGIHTQFVTVTAHGSVTVTFSGFPAGTYGILSNTPGFKNVTRIPATIATCPVTPTTPTTPGQTLGTDTTRTVTTLPKTGANSSISLLFALLAASVTYTIVLALEKRRLATIGNK